MTLETIPALVKLFAVFLIMILAIGRKMQLAVVFFLGALLAGILYGMSSSGLFYAVLRAATSEKTLTLAVIVALIILLSSSLESAGQLQRLLAAFRSMTNSSRCGFIVFPALIGLLPMPGGAVFSAPMVKELAASSNHSREELVFYNYWFRHIWEYWWPFYPGVLMTCLLADFDLGFFILAMFPGTLVAFLCGYYRLRRLVPNDHEKSASFSFHHFRLLLWELMPILIAVFPGIIGGFGLSLMLPEFLIAKETGLIVALCLAVIWTWKVNGFSSAELRAVLGAGHQLRMMAMIFSIMIFSGVLTESNAVRQIASELSNLQIPLLLIVATLPFIAGLVTGITIAFVGSTFPILIPLIQTLDPQASLLPYMMLALVCGFTGVMLSPLHLCLILTNEYFESRVSKVYRRLWKPCLGLVVFAFLYFPVLRLVLA